MGGGEDKKEETIRSGFVDGRVGAVVKVKNSVIESQIGEKKWDEEDPDAFEVINLTVVHGKPCSRSRLPCDRRKMRKIRLFDPTDDGEKPQKRSEAMLQRAKQRVLKELSRQQTLGIYKTSNLEQAFLDATGETHLTFNYESMKKLVRNAHFGDSNQQKCFATDDDAFNDNVEIILNRERPFVEREIASTLLHECLHNTVERCGKRGNPQLSEKTEHIAMALLGDRDEQQVYFQRYFNLDYINESWLKVHQRKKRRRNPKYHSQTYVYS